MKKNIFTSYCINLYSFSKRTGFQIWSIRRNESELHNKQRKQDWL